ncbi:hypothetical protein N9Z83_00165 [Akkermansiaceae bacterium]|nr:hypothetical protein [Akkermansiaceae bacterium]
MTSLLGFIASYLFHQSTKQPSISNLDPSNDSPAKEIEMEFISPPIEWIGRLPLEVMRAFQDAQTVQDYLVHLDEIEDEAREFFTTGPGSRKKISRFSKPPNFQANDTRLYF